MLIFVIINQYFWLVSLVEDQCHNKEHVIFIIFNKALQDMSKRTRTNTLQNHVNEITDDRNVKRPLNTLFILMKHRKQWFDRKLQSDTITQLTKFLSSFKTEQVIV